MKKLTRMLPFVLAFAMAAGLLPIMDAPQAHAELDTNAEWGDQPGIKQISASGTHTVAVKTDGSLWAWGYNNYGELGDGTTIDKNAPVRIGSDTNWSFVTAGTHHTMAVKDDGSLWAWGWNYSGQLGDGITTYKNIPTQIGTDTDWLIVTAGMLYTTAVKADGSLWAWGYNQAGRLGDGTTTGKNIPTRIGTDTDWLIATAGFYNAMAVKADGSVWAWGDNQAGQLGDGTDTNRHSPVQIWPLDDEYWSDIWPDIDDPVAPTDGIEDVHEKWLSDMPDDFLDEAPDIGNEPRYTALVLDVSGSMQGAPLRALKEAAKLTCKTLLEDVPADKAGQIAIIAYSGTSRTVCDFTGDLGELEGIINGLKVGGSTNIHRALQHAEHLLKNAPAESIKNIVFMSDGQPNRGETLNSGRYPNKYANAAYEKAVEIRGAECKMTCIYTLSFFHKMTRKEWSSKSQYAVAKEFMEDMQCCGYYDVILPVNLADEFKEIADKINSESKGGQPTYTVAFNTDSGSVIEDYTRVPHGSTIFAPTAPTKTGYSFGGWYKDAELTNAWIFGSDTVTTDTTLYAKWDQITTATYTVIYNGNNNTGGAAPTDTSSPYNSGSPVTVLGAGSLDRTNYTFMGWSTSSNATTAQYTAGNSFNIFSNTTLYAVWAINTYTVTFDTDGGSIVAALPEVPHGSKISAPSEPTKTGHKFDGWHKDTELANAWNFDLDTVTSATTLYAKWNPLVTYTITYNGNGSESGTIPIDSESPHISGSWVAVIGNTGNLAKSDHKFIGWNTEPDGSGISYAAGSLFIITSDTTLYAEWVESDLVISVTSVTLSKNITELTEGNMETLTATVFPVDATIKGVTWESSNKTVATVYGGQIKAVGAGSATITAKTTDGGQEATCTVVVRAAPIQYSVTVESGTGSGRYLQGAVVSIFANPALSGQRFSHWTASPSVSFVNANSADTSFVMPANAVTLTANYVNDAATTNVTFTAIQIGGTSETADSTGIQITFSRAVTGLSINDITVNNGTGTVVQGALSGTGSIYTVSLSSVITQGDVTVEIGDFGAFNVTTASQSVTVYKNTSSSGGGGVVYGDLSGKGYVDNSDLILMLRLFSQPDLAVNMAAADVNGDGVVDQADLILLLKYFTQPGIILGPQ